jgi:hypothetical protein
MQCDHDVDGANSAVLDLVSVVYCAMCNLCLGRLDPAKFRHVGQLLAVGYHRHCGTGQNVDDVKKAPFGAFYFCTGLRPRGCLAGVIAAGFVAGFVTGLALGLRASGAVASAGAVTTGAASITGATSTGVSTL